MPAQMFENVSTISIVFDDISKLKHVRLKRNKNTPESEQFSSQVHVHHPWLNYIETHEKDEGGRWLSG